MFAAAAQPVRFRPPNQLALGNRRLVSRGRSSAPTAAGTSELAAPQLIALEREEVTVAHPRPAAGPKPTGCPPSSMALLMVRWVLVAGLVVVVVAAADFAHLAA